MVGTDGSMNQLVFVDGRVSDIDTLTTGLVPGAVAHRLDPARDGLTQIATILTDGLSSNLRSISIIAHGAPGRLEVGPDGVTEADLAHHSEAFAALAGALSPHGAVQLYACDLAGGPSGHSFVRAFSRALGGATVTAASHPLGATRDGGSWDLDTATGPIAPTVPFTRMAQAAFSGHLAAKFTTTTDTIGDLGPFDSRMIYGDFDGDGDIDILYQNGNTTSSPFGYKQNDGHGNFTDYANASSAGTPFAGFDFSGLLLGTRAWLVFDIDNDGDLDIARRDNDARALFRNDNGHFVAVADPIGDIGPFDSRMIYGDFDKDGDIDILYQNGNTTSSPFGYKQNDGHGNFTDYANASAAGTPFSSVDFSGMLLTTSAWLVFDIDNDGDLDIAKRDNDARALFRNDNGHFVTVADPIGDIGPFDSRMIYGDFDSDGDIDILYQNGNTTSSPFGYKQNDGHGNFTDYANASAAGTPFAGFDFSGLLLNTSAWLVFDVDHDGDVDIVRRDNDARALFLQGGDGNGAPPKLISSSPADGATGFAPSGNIVLTFDEAVTGGAGLIEIHRASDGVVVASFAGNSAQVTGSGTNVITLNPTTDLAGSTGYYITFQEKAFVDSDGMTFGTLGDLERNGITDSTFLNFTTAAANTVPTSNHNTGLTVSEGGAVTIAATALDFNDAEQADTAITYTVTTAATNGTLYKSGLALGLGGSFTQDDLNNGRITYTHDGGETTSASFGFSVSDGQGGTVAGQTFGFTVTLVNDAPGIVAPASFTATEQTALSLKNAISVSDVDSGGGVETLTLSVGDGTLTVAAGTSGASVSGSGTSSVTIQGTIAQINALLGGDATSVVSYTNGSDTPPGSVSLQLTLDDNGLSGTGGSLQTVATPLILITAVDDAPTLTGAQAILANGVENTDYTITRAALLQGFTDVDTATASLTIGSLTADHGTVVDNGDGTYTVTPTPGYDGLVILSYDVGDGTSATSASLSFTLANLVQGTAGDDLLHSTARPDLINGLQGADTVSYEDAAGPVTASLADPSANTGEAAGDTYAGIENLRGSGFGDTLTGDSGDNIIEGGAGGDTLTGGGGVDWASYVRSGAGVTVNLATSSASGGDATGDTLTGFSNLVGSIHADTLTGDGGANILDGNGSDDATGDSLHGGGGDDTLKLRDNPAVVDGGTGKDTLILKVGATVTLTDASFAAIERVYVQNGGSLDMSDVTTGGVLIRSFATSGGSVSITGTRGNDVVQAGTGAETFHFNEAGYARDRLIDVDLAHDSFDFSGLANDMSDLIVKSINGGVDTEIRVAGMDRSDAVVLKGVTAAVVLTDGHFLF